MAERPASDPLDQVLGLLGEVARSAFGPDADDRLDDVLALLRRRLTGDYEVDLFGFDAELTETVLLPLLRPLYRYWFRVDTRGVENIPGDGAALVVANHSGTIPLDSLMTQVAVHDEHPNNRHLRMLGADLVFRLPIVAD
ncbi:MAG: 1-acyl-sn-glycerol-3-phosphate acyltransferase, partial [Actinomycetota bacterium]